MKDKKFEKFERNHQTFALTTLSIVSSSLQRERERGRERERDREGERQRERETERERVS